MKKKIWISAVVILATVLSVSAYLFSKEFSPFRLKSNIPDSVKKNTENKPPIALKPKTGSTDRARRVKAKKRKLPPEIEKRMQENRMLLEKAKNGKDKTIQYVRLTRENRYTDHISPNLFLTRDATSGPGTGRFTGSGLIFCKGNCDEVLNKGGNEKGPPLRWFKKINQCRQRILENDWCALSKSNKQESYTIKILSWPIEQSDCTGDCAEHDYQTAYIRIKSK